MVHDLTPHHKVHPWVSCKFTWEKTDKAEALRRAVGIKAA
jgi:hypothetical protein